MKNNQRKTLCAFEEDSIKSSCFFAFGMFMIFFPLNSWALSHFSIGFEDNYFYMAIMGLAITHNYVTSAANFEIKNLYKYFVWMIVINAIVALAFADSWISYIYYFGSATVVMTTLILAIWFLLKIIWYKKVGKFLD